MERMDRVEAYHAVWEAKKAFVNTVRMQTLDRFYNRKIENEQKEMASTWAPHRRARGEYHKYHETMASNLDTMPMKERLSVWLHIQRRIQNMYLISIYIYNNYIHLIYTYLYYTLEIKNIFQLELPHFSTLHQELKKVLTPTVLHGDREAIRAITKRIQTEETWKVAWKEMELARRAETQADMEHRMTYNAMLMELAGQAPRANHPRKPRKCSNRVSDLARPAKPKTPDDITKRSDYAGLVHVDHRHAMEARFPGAGHAFTATFTAAATERSKPAFPPPEPPATPAFPEDRAPGSREP